MTNPLQEADEIREGQRDADKQTARLVRLALIAIYNRRPIPADVGNALLVIENSAFNLDVRKSALDNTATPQQPAIITPVTLDVSTFIGRWTATEYSNLMKARATAIQNNSAGMALVKQWDQAISLGTVDMGTQVAKDFKASLVSAGILTQVRADVIFQ